MVLTGTIHSAVFSSFSVVTVMVVVPEAFAVITPLVSWISAISGWLLDHFTSRFVALHGQTVAVSVAVSPTFMVCGAEEISRPVTGMYEYTVTVHSAVFPLPSAVVARMIASPSACAKTVPPLTEATQGLLLYQVTLSLVVFSGKTVAERMV